MFVFNPSPSEKSYENISSDKSSIKDSRFGGKREHIVNSPSDDYTKRTSSFSDIKENPEDVPMDIDDLVNTMEIKSEFSYQTEKNKVGDEKVAIISLNPLDAYTRIR